MRIINRHELVVAYLVVRINRRRTMLNSRRRIFPHERGEHLSLTTDSCFQILVILVTFTFLV